MYIYIYIYICMCVYIYIYIYIYVHTHINKITDRRVRQAYRNNELTKQYTHKTQLLHYVKRKCRGLPRPSLRQPM